MLAKMLFTADPAVVTAATATREIRATSIAYSIRSWPSSSRTKLRRRVMKFISALRRVSNALSVACVRLPSPPNETTKTEGNGCTNDDAYDDMRMQLAVGRSEERRVGKECRSGRS